MPPSQIAKLQAQTAHLLDLAIGLEEKYALLDPMLFDETTTGSWSSGERARGFKVLRNTVFLSCIQDLTKAALDADDRTPSVARLVAALDDSIVRDQLRESYAVWGISPIGIHSKEVRAAAEAWERRDEDKRREQFDSHVRKLREKWTVLRDSSALAACKRIRDKLVAHTDIHHDGDSYHVLDVGTLGLKWGDLKSLVEEVRIIVATLNLIFRNASFAFDLLDEQLQDMQRSFWTPGQ